MNAVLLICATLIQVANCQPGAETLRRQYALESTGIMMCQLETMQKAAADPEPKALLAGGGFYPKIFCSVGNVGNRG
jgi:hypothetical protein